jgi:hypothetical protein
MTIIYRLIFNYEINFGYWLFFVPIIFFFLVAAVFIIPIKFLTKKYYDGWKFWLKYLVALVVGMEFSAYAQDVYVRTNHLYEECKSELSPDRNHIGEVCVIEYSTDYIEHHLWLKVYDAKTSKLIKEGDGGSAVYGLHWKIESGQVVSMYSDTIDWREALTLPPSWLDKMRAKLP